MSGRNGKTFSPEDFGRTVWGPLLADLCRWLLEETHKDGITELYFVSRDSYLLYCLFKETMGPDGPAVYYLEVSRRALGLGAQVSAGASPVDGGRVFCSCESRQYLTSFPLRGNCGLVDIGWHGSIPLCLQELPRWRELALKVYLVGYAGPDTPALQVRSYLRRRDSLASEAFVGLWELLMMEDKGSPVGHVHTQNGWQPVRAAHVPCGTALAARPGSSARDRQAWLLLRLYAVTGAVLLLREMDRRTIAARGRTALRCFLRMGRHPRREEAEFLGVLLFQDDLSCSALAAPRSLRDYLREPMHLLADYHDSRWKCGFLRLLLPLPSAAFPLWRLLRSADHRFSIRDKYGIIT